MTATIANVQPDMIPAELTERDQWVVWRIEECDGKRTKVPYDAQTGRHASSTDPSTWAAFSQALVAYETDTRWDGVGFVVSADDPYTGIDLDDHRNPETGELSTRAAALVAELDSYAEQSPSGTGIRVFVHGTKPGTRCKRAFGAGAIEIYDTARFFTVTGQQLDGAPITIEPRQEALNALYEAAFGKSEPEPSATSSASQRSLSVSDDDILDRARRAENGAKFVALWNGDVSGHNNDDSAADLALCSMLAFWCGPDPQRIEHLFSQSQLGGRAKWQNRADYRERTIQAALRGRTEYHEWPEQRPTFTLNGDGGEASDLSSHSSLLSQPEWPAPPSDAVYYGLAGEIVRSLEPTTEADPVAVLLTLLSAVGNIVGPGPHWTVSGSPHYLLINPILIGPTSKGRKGTAWSTIKPILKIAAPDWLDRCTASGLSSGEGLIWAVRDPITKTEPIKENKQIVGYQEVITDPGIEDKRLFVTEEEFASTLKVMSRESNILSTVIRQAWDHGDLRTLVKNSPARATGAHISIVGHITKDELLRYLDTTEAANGFANRFLWACVRRSKLLPEGGGLDLPTIQSLGDRLKAALEYATHIDHIKRDEQARELWHQVYGPLSEGGLGLLGAITSRAEAQVMRLAALYAVLNQSRLIRHEHLNAALSLWGYLEASVEYVFGDRLGDPDADTILSALRHADGLTKTEISNLFGRNLSASRIDRALGQLLSVGKVRCEQRSDGPGRPAEVWSAA